ncbi:LuxR C-terminal-related transcriptional regulator [Cupriavidus sp. 2TAF22]|uniref:helix-turn-helix transcriptional regulator n=1 Tax=unclassified Cupriavidus TaxID=2640874 RepID=UPI003F8F849A
MITQSYEAVLLCAQRELRDTLLASGRAPARPGSRELAAEMLLNLDDAQACWRVAARWLRASFAVDRVDAGFHTPGQRYYIPSAQALASDDVPQMAGTPIDTHEAGVASLWLTGEPIAFREVDSDARLSRSLRRVLTHAHTASKLATCVRHQSRPVGLICLDQLDRVRNWSEQDALQLKSVAADILGPILHAARQLAAQRDAACGEGAAPPADASQLTASEARVARLVARGLSYKEIARELERSHSTVDHHLRSIRQKLGVSSTSRLIRVLAGIFPQHAN